MNFRPKPKKVKDVMILSVRGPNHSLIEYAPPTREDKPKRVRKKTPKRVRKKTEKRVRKKTPVKKRSKK